VNAIVWAFRLVMRVSPWVVVWVVVPVMKLVLVVLGVVFGIGLLVLRLLGWPKEELLALCKRRQDYGSERDTVTRDNHPRT